MWRPVIGSVGKPDAGRAGAGAAVVVADVIVFSPFGPSVLVLVVSAGAGAVSVVACGRDVSVAVGVVVVPVDAVRSGDCWTTLVVGAAVPVPPPILYIGSPYIVSSAIAFSS